MLGRLLLAGEGGVSEDAILGLAYGPDAKISDDVIEQIYTETESFAFVPVWERK